MNRIEECFARLKREGKKGFIVYIGAGDPNLDATRQLALNSACRSAIRSPTVW
jgi:tryptophan synthase alpha chain